MQAGLRDLMGVCRSVFYLPKPRPLNHLVQDLFSGPTLVLQGAKVKAKIQQPMKASFRNSVEQQGIAAMRTCR